MDNLAILMEFVSVTTLAQAILAQDRTSATVVQSLRLPLHFTMLPKALMLMIVLCAHTEPISLMKKAWTSLKKTPKVPLPDAEKYTKDTKGQTMLVDRPQLLKMVTLVADKVVTSDTELAQYELQHGPVAHYYWNPPIRSMDPGPSAQRCAPQLGVLVHTNHSMGLLLPGAIAGVAVERLETTKANAAAGGSVLLSAAVAVAATALLVLVAAAALLVLMLLLALQALLLLQLLPAAFRYTVNPAAAIVTLCMPTGISQATKGNHHHVGPPLVTTALSHIRRSQICETAYRTTWN